MTSMRSNNDLTLISQVQKDADSESYLELKKRYENCYYDIYHKYKFKLYESGFSGSDCISDVDYVLLNSILSYDEDRGAKFSTHFTCRSYYHFKTLVSGKSSERYRFTESIDRENCDFDPADESNIFSPIEYANFSSYKDLVKDIIENRIKSEKQKEVISTKYFSFDKVLSVGEVAEKLGMSKRLVHHHLKECITNIKKILQEEKKLSLNFEESLQ